MAVEVEEEVEEEEERGVVERGRVAGVLQACCRGGKRPASKSKTGGSCSEGGGEPGGP